MMEDFEPDYGQTYYRVAGNGLIASPVWKRSKRDLARYAFGNCFATRELAEDAQLKSKELFRNLKKK